MDLQELLYQAIKEVIINKVNLLNKDQMFQDFSHTENVLEYKDLMNHIKFPKMTIISINK